MKYVTIVYSVKKWNCDFKKIGAVPCTDTPWPTRHTLYLLHSPQDRPSYPMMQYFPGWHPHLDFEVEVQVCSYCRPLSVEWKKKVLLQWCHVKWLNKATDKQYIFCVATDLICIWYRTSSLGRSSSPPGTVPSDRVHTPYRSIQSMFVSFVLLL